jgi:hypothetical protein
MQEIIGIIVLVCVLIIAHFTQRTAGELKKVNAQLERVTQDLENLMRGAETYMNAMLKKQ